MTRDRKKCPEIEIDLALRLMVRGNCYHAELRFSKSDVTHSSVSAETTNTFFMCVRARVEYDQWVFTRPSL